MAYKMKGSGFYGKGNQSPAKAGCLDRDNDGVVDKNDTCPKGDNLPSAKPPPGTKLSPSQRDDPEMQMFGDQF